jgi:hypothetical protein
MTRQSFDSDRIAREQQARIAACGRAAGATEREGRRLDARHRWRRKLGSRLHRHAAASKCSVAAGSLAANRDQKQHRCWFRGGFPGRRHHGRSRGVCGSEQRHQRRGLDRQRCRYDE